MNRIITLLLLLGLGLSLSAQQGRSLSYFDKEIPRKAEKEFQFIAYYFNQGVSGNYFPTNDFLRGQVFGKLFGQNTTQTSDTATTVYFEQRLIPFFIYQPKLLNGRAILRASFEIDWTWGDVSYTAGGNFGSALSADVVNIQTQNVELELIPAKGWAINLGLQRLFDTPYNPYRTLFGQMTESAYRLAYWGTDAVGISVRRDYDYARWKAGFYQLYENNIQENDDVVLYEYTFEQIVSPRLRLGGSAYYVRDRANGEGGPSILGQGLNATLNAYNGTYRFPLGSRAYWADVVWLGAFGGYNQDYMDGRFFATAFAKYNLGQVRAENSEGEYENFSSIGGLGANLRLGYRYGQTADDRVVADLIFATGDEVADDRYTGVMTGNTWGAPAGIFISHGAYILFPHGNVVNRFVSAVGDLSNQGYGLLGGVLSLQRDLLPHKLNAKVGAAYARSQVAPRNGGQSIGWELNGRISYQPAVFMNIELHGAYMGLGDYFDSPLTNGNLSQRPVNPWTVFFVYKWLMF
jgi:hypothetical protein